MALQYGLIVPQGWRMDLLGISDPVEAYETMTRVAQEAEQTGFDSIWLFDHFHTVPTPMQEVIIYMPDAKDLTSVRMFAQECIQQK